MGASVGLGRSYAGAVQGEGPRRGRRAHQIQQPGICVAAVASRSLSSLLSTAVAENQVVNIMHKLPGDVENSRVVAQRQP